MSATPTASLFVKVTVNGEKYEREVPARRLLVHFLRDDLDLLNPRLAILERATLDRDDFTQLYVESLCILSEPNRNVPDPAICDLIDQ